MLLIGYIGMLGEEAEPLREDWTVRDDDAAVSGKYKYARSFTSACNQMSSSNNRAPDGGE